MKKQLTIATFIILTIISVVGLYTLYGVLLLDSQDYSFKSILWLGDATTTNKNLSQLSDSLSIILGVPTALLGTFFAIIIAEKAYSLSRETRDISIRSEEMQKRQDKLETYQFIEERIHHTINRFLELDASLRSLNYSGVVLNNFHHLDFNKGEKIDGSYLTGDREFPQLKALEFKFRKLSDVLFKIESDPFSRILFNKNWNPSNVIKDPYFQSREFKEIYGAPLGSILTILNSGHTPSLSDMPSGRIALGKASSKREYYGIYFVGWFLPITRKIYPVPKEGDCKTYRVNHYGFLLSDLWESIPSLEIIKKEFLEHYDLSMTDIDEQVVDKYFDNIKYELFLDEDNVDPNASRVNMGMCFYKEILRAGGVPEQFNANPETSSAKALYISHEV